MFDDPDPDVLLFLAARFGSGQCQLFYSISIEAGLDAER